MKSLVAGSLSAAAMLLAVHANPAQAAPRAYAISAAEDEQGTHEPEAAFDASLRTGWGEGEEGYGEGSWIELDLRTWGPVESVSFWPGNLSEGAKSFREYSRPRQVTVLVDREPYGDPIRLEDEMQRVDVPLNVDRARRIRLQVDEVYEGYVFSDCYIAEMALDYQTNLTKKNTRLEKWKISSEGEAARTAYEDNVREHYEAHKTAEFGAPESLEWIMHAAADGAPYLLEQVNRIVPLGYRAAFIHPDPTAISALRKLKDPNGIPALEMASLRATEEQAQELAAVVEIFYAYQKLIGGPNPNIPYWGDTGWGEGGIQSFGEPISITIDRFGMTYIADTGNNRVQRFAENGKPDRVWGGEPGITQRWFEEGRPWYVSGSAPGQEKGQFINPLAIVTIPHKESDGFAVLDAAGRIQIFDSDGDPAISWTIRSENRVEPDLGGEAYLAWVDKKDMLYAIWGDEAIGFDANGQELARWEIADGTPNAVAVEKGKKFLFAFRDEIVRYNLDGFRHGVVIDETDLMPGFEDVDITMDEEGRFWVLIDKGWAFKFKKPKSGKLEYSVRVTDYSLLHPRFAVRDDLLYIAERDRILKLDALQLKLDQEQAAEQAAAE